MIVFINNRYIRFTDKCNTYSVKFFDYTDTEKFKIQVLHFVSSKKKIMELYSPDLAQLAGTFFKAFPVVEAAGGAVICEGSILLIYKNGWWDMPKGKIEEGESNEYAAIREVSEECGIDSSLIAIGSKLPETYHLYFQDTTWLTKKTYWYKMNTASKAVLKPQSEEGIQAAEWHKLDNVGEILPNMHSSLRIVAEAVLYGNCS
jgi:8-oxo-(d)GTP phosphatase